MQLDPLTLRELFIGQLDPAAHLGKSAIKRIVEVSWEDRRWRSVVEVKRLVTPEVFSSTLMRLKQTATVVGLHPMLTAACLSPKEYCCSGSSR